jgi:hypothetical protein
MMALHFYENANILSNWPIDLADPIIYHEPHGEYRG